MHLNETTGYRFPSKQIKQTLKASLKNNRLLHRKRVCVCLSLYCVCVRFWKSHLAHGRTHETDLAVAIIIHTKAPWLKMQLTAYIQWGCTNICSRSWFIVQLCHDYMQTMSQPTRPNELIPCKPSSKSSQLVSQIPLLVCRKRLMNIHWTGPVRP